MAEASVVDESDLVLLHIHDGHLLEILSVHHTRGRRSRGMVWIHSSWMVGEGNRTHPLGHLRCRNVWVLEDEALDAPLGSGVLSTSSHSHGGIPLSQSDGHEPASCSDSLRHIHGANSRSMESPRFVPQTLVESAAPNDPHYHLSARTEIDCNGVRNLNSLHKDSL